jgi:hypothetical protein
MPLKSASLVVAAITLAVAPASAARPLKMADVLRSASEYVAEFHRQLSGIVAEERYVQQVVPEAPDRSAAQPPPTRRELRADLLLMVPAGGSSWVQFRDVFEVDGIPVRDRAERLTELLRERPATAAQANRIREESARYNLGNVLRTINVPLLPLQVLMPAHRARFKFERVEPDAPRTQPVARVPSSPHFKVSAEVWVISFRETKGRTLIREIVRNRDVPLEGRLWIAPDTGRVLMSEMMADTGDVRAQINVSYQSEPLLGLLVPVEMHETYWRERRKVITATATYGRFRQFKVPDDEPLKQR